MQALKQIAVAQCRVLRDGNHSSIAASLPVPGDVVSLEAGKAVPADLRIIDLKI